MSNRSFAMLTGRTGASTLHLIQQAYIRQEGLDLRFFCVLEFLIELLDVYYCNHLSSVAWYQFFGPIPRNPDDGTDNASVS